MPYCLSSLFTGRGRLTPLSIGFQWFHSFQQFQVVKFPKRVNDSNELNVWNSR